MPRKDRAARNEYMREYMLSRYHQRRAMAIAKLGGKCSNCGGTEDLDFDHKDPSTKTFTIAKGGSASAERFWAEVAKCQLMCKACHLDKTLREAGKKAVKGTHGTISSYSHNRCRCDLCKKAKREWGRTYRERKRAEAQHIEDG